MAKSDKLYAKSPKMERDENGDMEVKKASDTTGDEANAGEDGSNAEMQGSADQDAERKSMHSRHEEELKAMHKRHQKDVEEMHGRHEGKKDKK